MSRYLARLKAKNGPKPIPHELPKLPKEGFDSFDSYPGRDFSRNDGAKPDPFGSFGSDQGGRVFGIDGAPEPDGVEVEERAGMAMDSVPEPYLDAWARLQCQRPIGVGEAAWGQAIDDGGKFLDAWGSLAVEFGWTAGDLFDVPRDDGPGGLAWFCAGETVRSIGPDGAFTTTGRVFDRPTRAEWVNPYHRKDDAR
jgi:hypothetical protein